MSADGADPRPETNRKLEEIIARRIRESGPITFAEFMDMALYFPSLGYYTSSRERIGRQGDFYTSPDVHPIFGGLIAKQLAQMWRELGSPDVFTVVEMGAGKGLLCRDILAYARAHLSDFLQHLQYAIEERSPDFVDRQRKLLLPLEGATDRVKWLSPQDLDGLAVVGCFLSNELVDAFPVHVVAMEDCLREIYVGLDGDRFVEVRGDLSTDHLGEYFAELGISLEEGQRAEINLQALALMGRIGRALERGFVLTIDYGYAAEEMYSPKHREGTLLCYHRHTASDNPLDHVGCQDMTTHVDFTSLVRAGEKSGLRSAGLTTQAGFLTGLGIGDYLVDGLDADRWDVRQYYVVKKAIIDLVRHDGLGKNKVLIQYKNTGEPLLDGLKPSPFGGELLSSRS